MDPSLIGATRLVPLRRPPGLPGHGFALVEAALVLAMLGQRFHLDSGSERAAVFRGLTLQSATPVLATLRRSGPGAED